MLLAIAMTGGAPDCLWRKITERIGRVGGGRAIRRMAHQAVLGDAMPKSGRTGAKFLRRRSPAVMAEKLERCKAPGVALAQDQTQISNPSTDAESTGQSAAVSGKPSAGAGRS